MFRRAGAVVLRACWIALVIAGATLDDAAAEAAPTGVLHEISVAFTVDERFRAALASDSTFAAELRLALQVSDHAPDSDFFGVAVVDFTLDAEKLRAEKQVAWRDRQCHRDRGFPKVTVLGLDGAMRRDGTSSTIAAAPRRLGRHLVADEIIVQKTYTEGIVGAGGLSFIARSKSSGLLAEITLLSRPCHLQY